MATIGVVAGAGKLPIIFADSARKSGDKVVGVGLKGMTDQALENHVDKFLWFEMGSLQKAVFAVMTNRINKIVLLGKFRKDLFFKDNANLDGDAKLMFGKLSDKKDYSMLHKASDFLSKFGIEIIDPTPYLKDLVPAKGILTKRKPAKEEAEDIEYATTIAREVTRLDIGQTVAVKNKTVIAIEAIEGTDEAVTRAGALCGKGFVVVKMARPNQDMRFDVPLVGLETIETIIRAGATAFALEAGKTFLIDREAIIALADAKGLAIVIV